MIVEHGEGRELVDVDGRRCLDGISSLWVTTLGHRVPELDRALVEQAGRIAHSTLLGNGNRVVVELAEALARVVPAERPHVLFACDGASALEQALRIAFQYWANLGVRGRTSYLASGGAYHGDTIGALSVAADAALLVAEAGLGAINAVRLATAALAQAAPVVVLLNRYDPRDRPHRANLAWLRDRCGLDILVGPAALAARMTTPKATDRATLT